MWNNKKLEVMKKISTIIFLMLCVMATQKAVAFNYAAIPDSIAPDPEDEDYYLDTITKTPKRLATRRNVMDFSLESRYRPKHNEFTKKWYDHMYVKAGAGLMSFIPTSGNYKLNTLATVHGSLGKTLDIYNTMRLSLEYGSGYEKYSRSHFNAVRGSLEYLFNVSAFSRGYNPARPLEMQLLFGVGAYCTNVMHDSQPTRLSPEVHTGFQFKFLSGPYGHFTVEPYVGLTADKMDFSPDNWRKYDVFYGVNLSIVHSFTNNFSPKQRHDSLMYNPWFFEAGMGPIMTSRKNSPIDALPASLTTGLQMQWSVGKWISSTVGVRLSAHMASNRIQEGAGKNGFRRNFYEATCGGNVEGLINPFGFSKKFNWNSPFGAYIFAGVGYGSLNFSGGGNYRKRVSFESISGGAHLYATIDKDLQFFVEPRYSSYRHEGVRDDNVSVLFGLTAKTRSAKFRPRVLEPEEENDALPITAGLSFTTPIMMMQTSAYKDKGFSYGAKAFGQYRFTKLSSARLSIDYLSLSRAVESPLTESYMKGDQLVSHSSSRIADRRHGLLIATANYSVDMYRLLSGYQGPKRFNLEFYFGPGAAFYISESASAIGDDLPEGHTFKSNIDHKFKVHFAFTGGAKFSHNFSRQIGVYLEPSLHFISNVKMAGIQTISFVGNKMQLIPSVSLGAQYTL